MVATALWAQTNIVVLSDTHVMGPGLVVRSGLPGRKNSLATGNCSTIVRSV